MLEDEDAAARLADVEPIAERHLERDLDAGRARVREEGASERGGGDADQFGGEGFGGFVRPAGEVEMVELFGLVADCRHDARVGVAVGGDPPAGDGVDPASTVGGMETGVFGVDRKSTRLNSGHY